MAPAELFICDLDPDTETSLKVYLFKNVKNVEEIRNNIVSGAWGCAAVKPSLVLDVAQVAAAANRAALAACARALVTRSVYSEIVYNLSLSKNITQSLTKFGIEKDDNLLVCFLKTPEEDNSEEIIKQIAGEMCPIDDLDKFTNIKELKNVYKLNNLKGDCDLLDIIVSRMMTKNFISH